MPPDRRFPASFPTNTSENIYHEVENLPVVYAMFRLGFTWASRRQTRDEVCERRWEDVVDVVYLPRDPDQLRYAMRLREVDYDAWAQGSWRSPLLCMSGDPLDLVTFVQRWPTPEAGQ